MGDHSRCGVGAVAGVDEVVVAAAKSAVLAADDVAEGRLVDVSHVVGGMDANTTASLSEGLPT